MTALPESLNETGLRRKRQIADLGANFLLNQTHWSFDFKYRHDKQNGEQVSGANFLTSTTLLAAPVNYSTDQVDLGAQYARDNWQFRIGYYGSFFHNADTAVTWDNPFTPFGTANVGRMSVAPDNLFNQFSLSGGWQIVPSTRLIGTSPSEKRRRTTRTSARRSNPGISTQPLPRASLDGRIDTYNYTVRLTSRPIDLLSITADWVDDRRDNKTSQAAYPQVASDVYVASTLFNLPYSFDRSTFRALGDISVANFLKVELGAKGEHYDTTYQSVAKTSTGTGWLEFHTTTSSNYGFSFEVRPIASHDRRIPDHSDDHRRRKSAASPVRSRRPYPRRTAGHGLLRSGAECLARPVGRTTQGCLSTNPQSASPARAISASRCRQLGRLPRMAHCRRMRRARSSLRIRQAARTADRPTGSPHRGRDDHRRHLRPVRTSSQTHHGANVYASYTRESIGLSLTTPTVPGFPNNTFRDDGLRLFASYRFNEKSSLRFDYWHEHYTTQDWALDGVAPATIVNALMLGIRSPNFTVDQLSVSYRYAF